MQTNELNEYTRKIQLKSFHRQSLLTWGLFHRLFQKSSEQLHNGLKLLKLKKNSTTAFQLYQLCSITEIVRLGRYNLKSKMLFKFLFFFFFLLSQAFTKTKSHNFWGTFLKYFENENRFFFKKQILKKDSITFLGLLKFLTLKKDFITSLRLLKILILKNDSITFLWQNSYSAECWWTVSSEGRLSYHIYD